MTLTDYYKFERLPDNTTKSRLDCTASTKSYDAFEAKGNVYITKPDNYVKTSYKRKADLAMSKGTNPVSSIYRPNLQSNFGFGDVRLTTDLLLFVFSDFSIDADKRIASGAVVEVFICRGKRNNANEVYHLLNGGELDGEINALRRSVTKSVT